MNSLMNANQMIKNVRNYEKTIRQEFDKLSHIISQINLKKYQDEDITTELKKYNKSITNYKKAISGLNTNFKFLDAQNVMTIQEKMAIEEELDEFQNKFKEITKYVNL